MYYDTLVYDAPTLRHLIAVFGNTQLMVGTDYPFNFHDRTPVQSILQATADGGVRERLLYANARKFLNLECAA